MSQQPWMPLYVADYLGDTQHLSTEEHGAYLLILMSMWRGGRVKNDSKLLARLTRVGRGRWHKVAVNVIALFREDGDGFLYSPRLEREYEKGLLFRAKQANNSRLGHLAKSMKNKDAPPANGSPTAVPNAALPLPLPLKEKEEGASAPTIGFQGRVIKLSSSDYLRWKENYPNVDLNAELSAHDAFLSAEPEADRGRWFIRTATHLRNRNAALKATPKPNGAKALAADWETGAKRQLEERERPKISEAEREANLAKLRGALRRSVNMETPKNAR